MRASITQCPLVESGPSLSPHVLLPSPQASKTTPGWRDYVEYMSGIVVDGFGAAITASANYLLAQMDPELVRVLAPAPALVPPTQGSTARRADGVAAGKGRTAFCPLCRPLLPPRYASPSAAPCWRSS